MSRILAIAVAFKPLAPGGYARRCFPRPAWPVLLPAPLGREPDRFRGFLTSGNRQFNKNSCTGCAPARFGHGAAENLEFSAQERDALTQARQAEGVAFFQRFLDRKADTVVLHLQAQ